MRILPSRVCNHRGNVASVSCTACNHVSQSSFVCRISPSFYKQNKEAPERLEALREMLRMHGLDSNSLASDIAVSGTHHFGSACHKFCLPSPVEDRSQKHRNA